MLALRVMKSEFFLMTVGTYRGTATSTYRYYSTVCTGIVGYRTLLTAVPQYLASRRYRSTGTGTAVLAI
eukprot:COSAG01_NODE_1246_length_11073_cov_38.365683_5_plen_69_part_00